MKKLYILLLCLCLQPSFKTLAHQTHQKDTLILSQDSNYTPRLSFKDTFWGKEEAYQVCYPKGHRDLFYIIFLFISISLILSVIILRIKTSNNKKIKQKSKIIQKQNKEILSSISYAKKIQQAILPSNKEWESVLPNSTIFYKAKDIVAGDFYWLEETENYIFVAAADCTGHGVPGAMMSLLCSTALSKAIIEEQQTETNKILDTTKEILLKSFIKTTEAFNDGMDVCLIRIDKKKPLNIQYSGANNSLYVVNKNKELKEYKADKQPVGKFFNEKPFTQHSFTIEKNDTLYLFTDGYSDQFGGADLKKGGKKFMKSNLKKLLTQIASLPLNEQKQKLIDAFEEWRNSNNQRYEQVDDVLFIGIKV